MDSAENLMHLVDWYSEGWRGSYILVSADLVYILVLHVNLTIYSWLSPLENVSVKMYRHVKHYTLWIFIASILQELSSTCR